MVLASFPILGATVKESHVSGRATSSGWPVISKCCMGVENRMKSFILSPRYFYSTVHSTDLNHFCSGFSYFRKKIQSGSVSS